MMDLCERGEGDPPRWELDGGNLGRVENGDRIPHALDADSTVVGTRKWYDSR
jgi:hypothetical protein